ncbi:MAG: hypothetical protein K0S32_3489 [Bacteroidetes bacterium]|jgi:hypothetical protein|nr:hypothetical protein [Bacteroidota bacterium]
MLSARTYLLIVFLFVVSVKLTAQNLSRERKVTIHAGAMYYRSFVMKGYHEDNTSKDNRTHYSPVGDIREKVPGYYIGANLFFKPKEEVTYFIGTTLSYSQQRYHIYNWYKENKASYGSRASHIYNLDVLKDEYILSIEGGNKRNLGSCFYILNSVLIHGLVYGTMKEQGIYSRVSTTNTVSVTENQVVDKTTVNALTFSGVSYRFGLSAKIKDFEIHAFRNFGYPARPWWGLGVTYCLG